MFYALCVVLLSFCVYDIFHIFHVFHIMSKDNKAMRMGMGMGFLFFIS